MGGSFARITFTPLVKKQQALHGSRAQYERVERSAISGDTFTEFERDFISSRDSFYMATTGETGWPYIQHRGGKPGFLHILDDHTIAFADYRGNKQYISAGNIEHDDRVALLLMDYPSRSRLKILGRAKISEGAEAQPLIEQLSSVDVRRQVERAITIRIEAFDWNCQQNITPRYTEGQVIEVIAPMRQRLAELEEENKQLRGMLEEHALKI